VAPRLKTPPKKMPPAIKVAVSAFEKKDKKMDAAMMKQDERKDKKMLVEALKKTAKKQAKT